MKASVEQHLSKALLVEPMSQKKEKIVETAVTDVARIKVKKRVVKRRRKVRSVARSTDSFVQSVYALAKAMDEKEMEAFFGALKEAEVPFAKETLESFDWIGALRLLPRLMEFVEQRKALSGEEKEKQVVALILHMAQITKNESVFDEDAVQSLRIIIQLAVDGSRGKLHLNESTIIKSVRLMKHGSLWLAKHGSCGACCYKK